MCIAFVSLCIEIQRVDGAEVFILVTLPCEDAEIMHIEDEPAEPAYLHVGLGLDAVAASHVVVAVNHIEIVALCAAQQYAAEENALFETRQRSHLWKFYDDSRSHRCRFADAIRGEVRPVFHWFRVVIIEVLIDAKLNIHGFSPIERCRPETSQNVQGVDEGLVFAESEGHFSTKEIVGLVVVFTIHGIAVFHKEIDVGIVFATEDGTIVCQIAVAHTDGTVEGECLTIVVQVVGGPHAPCFARDDAVQTLDGIDDGGCCLTQESRETIGAVVENDVADAVCHRCLPWL